MLRRTPSKRQSGLQHSPPSLTKKRNWWRLPTDQQKIIGLWVDANQGSIPLPPSSLVDIVDKINVFLSTPNCKPVLHEWQHLASHLNWLLNVLPWARPALTALYHKTSGKSCPLGAVHINGGVISNLTWLASIIPQSVGVHFLDDDIWDDSAADLEVQTDASLTLGMSFVFGNQGFMYVIKECPPSLKIDVFCMELVAIMSAIHHVAFLDSGIYTRMFPRMGRHGIPLEWFICLAAWHGFSSPYHHHQDTQ